MTVTKSGTVNVGAGKLRSASTKHENLMTTVNTRSTTVNVSTVNSVHHNSMITNGAVNTIIPDDKIIDPNDMVMEIDDDVLIGPH